MGFLSHRVEGSDLDAGDHIYTWRTPVFAYSHHGIYVGNEKVVHFTQDQNLSSPKSSLTSLSSSVPDASIPCLDILDCGFREEKSGVVISCLNCFKGKGSVYRFQYEVGRVAFIAKLRGGTCSTAKSDPAEAVIDRAMHLLHHGFGKYDVFTNNCEDFALYCKTGLVCGRKDCGGSGQASSVLGFPVSGVVSLSLGVFGLNPVVIGAAAVANYALTRYAADVGVRDDVIKVKVEDILLADKATLHIPPRKRKRSNS